MATSLARMQWLNLPGSPRFYNLGVHSPIIGDFGMGFNLQTGTLGKFQTASPMRETQIGLSLAWNKQITEDLRLAVGLRGGLFNYNVNLSQLNRDVDVDIAFRNNDMNLWAPSIGGGIYLYKPQKGFVGVSVPRWVFVGDNPVNNFDIKYAINLHVYAFAGYVFDISKELKIKPTTQIKMTQGAPIQADLNLHFIFLDDYSIGGFYRMGGEAGIMAMAQISPYFSVVYSYDHRLAPINYYVNGSHEFGLQFTLPTQSNRRLVDPRYF